MCVVEQVFFLLGNSISLKVKQMNKQTKKTRKCQTVIRDTDIPGMNVTLLLKADNRIVSALHDHN